MIRFLKINKAEPYQRLKCKYDEAVKKNQKNVDAISISSFSKISNQVNSRYVNLKFIDDEEFIFFSNYNSPKAIEFRSHDQISCAIFWSEINIQIRIKAFIQKTSVSYNNLYFKSRSLEKNALAISSNQSNTIESFNKVKEQYEYSMKHDNLKECPSYWGGFSFRPFEIEFWEGNEFRLNKRDLFTKDRNWHHSILEP